MTFLLGYPIVLLVMFTGWALSGCLVEHGLSRFLGLALDLESRPPADRWLLRLALGIAAWILALFALAAAGLLQVVVLRVLFLVSSALGAVIAVRSHRTRSAGSPGAASPTPAAPDSPSPLGRTAAFLLARKVVLGAPLVAVVAVLLLQALRPDVSHDASVYHLTLPRLFLEHGGFFRVPFNVYSNWPLGSELLFATAMALRDYIAAKTVHFGFGLVTLVLASRLVGRGYGLFAAAIVLFNPVLLYEIRIAHVDLVYAFLLLSATWTLSQALDTGADKPQRRQLLWLAGICGGALCAVKLNGFFGPLVLLAVHAGWHLLARFRRDPHSGASRWFAEALRLGVPALVFGAPWLVKSWILTGNPAYPLLFGLFGGPEWSSQLAEQHASWQRSIGMGRSLSDWLLLPLRVILYGDFGYQRFDGRIHRGWLLLLPLGLAALRRDPLTRHLLSTAGLYFILWALTSQQMRFLIPILPLLAIAAARGLDTVLGRWRNHRPRLAAAGATAATVLVMVLLAQSAWVYIRQSVPLATDLAQHGVALQTAVIHPALRWVDLNLPADAQLLLINTNRGFFVPRPYLADSFFEASQISAAFADAETAAQALARAQKLGISHVLVENRAGIAYPPALVDLLQDPAFARVLHTSQDQRYTVLELATPATP